MTSPRTIRLGTRGSALALAQAELAAAALRAAYPDATIETRIITTSGDQKLDISLIKQTPSGAKGLFTKEIEEYLVRGEIDVAVHSCKDMPGAMLPGLVLAAVLERARTADVLISKGQPFTLETLPEGAHVATSSVRRARQLLWKRPDLKIEEIRGNVQTRLRKLTESATLSGIVLAQAGLERLGLAPTDGTISTEQGTFYTSILDTYPAIAQGAIALQTREADAELVAPVNHQPTWRAVRAERELMRLLNGDCNLPVGVRTREEGDSLYLDAILFSDDVSEPPREASAQAPGNLPEAVAALAYAQLSNKPLF